MLGGQQPASGCHIYLRAVFLKRVDGGNGRAGLTRDFRRQCPAGKARPLWLGYGGLGKADLDEPVEEAIVDAYGEDEQLAGLYTMIAGGERVWRLPRSRPPGNRFL